MRRRVFLTLLGTAAAVLPRRLNAQAAPRLIGFLSEASADQMGPRVEAFRQGLREVGYADGHDLTIDWRSAERQPNRLRALANDLVGRHVAALVTASDAATAAGRAVTSTIPIVFLSPNDPARTGATADRRNTNVTGLSWFGPDLAPSRLSLLRQLVPQASTFGLLVDADLPESADLVHEVRTAADTTGVKLVVVQAGTAAHIETAFATLMMQHAGGLVVGRSDFFTSHREQLIELATRNALPAVYATYEMAADGGLASYGQSASDAFRRAGVYTGWILQGASPASLPVLSSSKIDLAINLRTAKALGLEVSHNVLAGADIVLQ